MSTLAKKKRIADQHAEDKKYLLEKGWICRENDDDGKPMGSEVWSRLLPDDAETEIVRTFRKAYKAQVKFDCSDE